jgi:hypothetical protein
VPVWALSVAFRPGQQVQDVQLHDRHGLVALGDLSLPVTAPAIDGAPSADAPVDPAVPRPGSWYPDLDRRFDWSVEKMPNGGSTLYILLYPFYYDPGTGDALYYRKHQLEVTTLVSPARIEALDAPSGGNEPGQPVPLELVVSRTGLPADVVVQARVETRATGQVLGGLPLKALHELVGQATVGLSWDTRGYEAGDYQIVVELLDTRGLVLDQASTDIRLGTYGAQLTQFSASQEVFTPGDQIGLTMGVANTGTVSIDGTAVFRIQQSPDLSVTEAISVPIRGLGPGAARKFSVNWDTRGVEGTSYRVLGYFKFFSRTTEPRALHLHWPRIFLPVVVRDH